MIISKDIWNGIKLKALNPRLMSAYVQLEMAAVMEKYMLQVYMWEQPL